jgi:NAD+ kinase
MRVAIHGRKFNETALPYVSQVFEELNKKHIDWQISESFCKIVKESGLAIDCNHVFKAKDQIFDADLVLSLGGDGTFLETLSYVGSRELPIMGINFGRLGFLATTNPADVQSSLNEVLDGEFVVDQRTLLSTDIKGFKGANFALNEIAITKTDTSSMIVIHAYVDGQFLNSYWADGLMVSTPTGSTGYSLSCGGPVVLPHSANFIITPICPHNLFVRPMIISDAATVELQVESRSKNYLVALDARARVENESETKISIKKEAFNAHLVQVKNDNFLNTLRTKLNWGIDARN